MASGGWCLDAKEPNCPADAHPARLSVMLMVGAVFFGDEALVPRASRDKVVFREETRQQRARRTLRSLRRRYVCLRRGLQLPISGAAD